VNRVAKCAIINAYMEFKEQQDLKVFAEASLNPGEMIDFESGDGAREIVFGRRPTANYAEGEKPPIEIGLGIMPVRLVQATNKDTSRQQFGIERRGNGPFVAKNYSKDRLRLEGVEGGNRDLQKGMATRISADPLGMQRVRISWQGGCEVSVQSVRAGSDDKKWSVGFMWKKS